MPTLRVAILVPGFLALATTGCGWELCAESCGDGRRCIEGRCVEDPCRERDCGSDGYGGSCGACDGACVAGRCRRCPEEMVLIPGELACIDRYEASEVNTGAPPLPGRLLAASRPGYLPLANVTWDQASIACQLLNKRLCKEAEWRGACSGGRSCDWPDSEQPYGCGYEEDRCHGRPPVELPPHTGPIPTGSKASCQGDLPGLFDMVGNVREWIADCTYGATQCMAVGGSFDDDLRRGCGFPSTYSIADETGPEFGFRCCKAVCTDSPACTPR